MILRKISLILLILMLLSCGRSKEAIFYLLNPLAPTKNNASHYSMQIGIDEIELPKYTQKSQLMIHYTPYKVQLEEYHRWAESLANNIGRVIKANLTSLLPGAIIERYPWDTNFKPNYHIQIDIFQFEIDYNGDSILRATYLISSGLIIKKYNVMYRIKLTNQPITVEALVKSMNTNLNHLTIDIAKSLKASDK
ncbi:PqiC family protein [Legionella sp. D16C41]|uniref:PqiC family protein n=1 Tax=Legionella sp. D16C41 TaxID=3402688 RepID=UPI003AF48A89